MLFVMLNILIQVAGSFVMVGAFSQSQRLCDRLVETCLLWTTVYYGIPIILGWSTGLLNTFTLVISAGIVVGGAFYCHTTSDWKVIFRRLVTCHRSLVLSEKLLLLVVLAFLVTTLLLGSLLPIRTWDAASYHVLGPIRWVQSGKFILDSFGEVRSWPYLAAGQTYPNVKAILPFMVMLWGKSVAGTALAQWPFLVLLVVTLFAIYRRLSFPHWSAGIGVLFCIVVPEVILQSVEAYADICYFSGITAVLWVILRTWQNPDYHDSPYFAAMAFTALAGTKPTAALSCVALGSLYLFVVFLKSGEALPLRRRAGLVLRSLGLVLALAIAVVGVWPISAYREFKNPVYPIEAKIAGTILFEGPYPSTMNDEFQTRYTGRSGMSALWGTLSEQFRPPVIASWGGGLGLAAFALGIPSLVVGVLLFPFTARPKGIGVIAAGIVLLVLSSKSLSLGRFSLFLLLPASLAIGLIAPLLTRWSRTVLWAVCLGCLAYNLYVTFPSVVYRQRPWQQVGYHLLSGVPQYAKDDLMPGDYGPINYWLDEVANPEAKLAIDNSIPVWSVFDPAKRPDIVRIPVEGAPEFDGWLEQIATSKATHVMVPVGSPHYGAAAKAGSKLKRLYSGVTGKVQRPEFMATPVFASLYEVVGAAGAE